MQANNQDAADQINQPLVINDLQESINDDILAGDDVEPNSPRDLVIYQPTQIFENAKEYFKQCHRILAFYTALKFIAATTLVILFNTLHSCTSDPIEPQNEQVWGGKYLYAWMEFSILHSLGATLYYIALLRACGNKDQMNKVAIDLEQCIIIEIPADMINSMTQEDITAFVDQQRELQNLELQQRLDQDVHVEESRKVSMLASEIKKKIFESTQKTKLIGKACFILFQILQFWGLVFYFANYSKTLQNCYAYFSRYLFLVKIPSSQVVFLGIYQYLEIYIMTLLLIVFLPIILCYTAYDKLKTCLAKRRERRRLESVLTESIFSLQEHTLSDNECAICMQSYENEDKIVTLQCSDKHHFHSSCVKSWLEVNSKCPLCRVEVVQRD